MLNIAQEVVAMERMTVKQLKVRYMELFGEETRTGNKAWLVKRLAWRLQMLQEGDLTERAKKRAEELANDADLRVIPPALPATTSNEQQTTTQTVSIRNDDRLPPPGTVLHRKYKSHDYQVQVLANGFEYDGKIYRSLSAVAKTITGSHCNGFAFFKLEQGEK